MKIPKEYFTERMQSTFDGHFRESGLIDKDSESFYKFNAFLQHHYADQIDWIRRYGNKNIHKLEGVNLKEFEVECSRLSKIVRAKLKSKGKNHVLRKLENLMFQTANKKFEFESLKSKND